VDRYNPTPFLDFCVRETHGCDGNLQRNRQRDGTSVPARTKRVDAHDGRIPCAVHRADRGPDDPLDRVNEKGIGIPDRYRYWLDSERDYIVMRCDMVMRESTGHEKIIESDTIEENARSSQGVWEAPKTRRRFPDREAKDKSLDQVDHIDVDFDTILPDSLIEPQSPGIVR
jgi:hypothetical protein